MGDKVGKKQEGEVVGKFTLETRNKRGETTDFRNIPDAYGHGKSQETRRSRLIT